MRFSLFLRFTWFSHSFSSFPYSLFYFISHSLFFPQLNNEISPSIFCSLLHWSFTKFIFQFSYICFSSIFLSNIFIIHFFSLIFEVKEFSWFSKCLGSSLYNWGLIAWIVTEIIFASIRCNVGRRTVGLECHNLQVVCRNVYY